MRSVSFPHTPRPRAAAPLNAMMNATVMATLLAATPLAWSAADPVRGATLYSTSCTGCHGAAYAPTNPLALNARNASSVLRNAISTNRGGMGFLGSLSEEDVADIEVGQNRRKVALQLDKGTGSSAESCLHLIGNDGSECGLSKAGRSVEKDMVERFAALPCGLNRDVQVFFDVVLTDVLGQSLRAQRQFERSILFSHRCSYDAFLHAIPSSESEAPT